MDKINITFLAGCMNRQQGIDDGNLYHQVIQEKLSSEYAEINFHLNLNSYRSYDNLLPKALKLIDGNHPDIFCLFIRHFPLLPLHKIFIRYEKKNNRNGWAIHPQLFNRELKWHPALSEFQSMNEFVYTNKKVFGSRDLNILTGLLFGLHNWALRYVWKQVLAVKAICDRNNIKLIVVSPVRNPESLLGDIICRRIGTKIGKRCNDYGIDYVNISTFSLDYFEKDKVHLNNEGHILMGQLISKLLITIYNHYLI